MRLFRSLAQQLGFARDPANEELFGLAPEQIGALRTLRASDGWKTYVELLDTAVTLYGEALLAARDDASMRESRGMILGLRKAAHIVDETLRHSEENDRAKQQREFATRSIDNARSAALWGSAAYGRAVTK
jgi:hypothetical protein